MQKAELHTRLQPLKVRLTCLIMSLRSSRDLRAGGRRLTLMGNTRRKYRYNELIYSFLFDKRPGDDASGRPPRRASPVPTDPIDQATCGWLYPYPVQCWTMTKKENGFAVWLSGQRDQIQRRAEHPHHLQPFSCKSFRG